jgi:hypothetical protein
VKKYFVVALAAMFVLGFAASSFAIHAEIPAETQAVVAKSSTQITIGGEIRVRGIIDNNTQDFNSDKTSSGDDAKWDQRVRLQVEAKITPNTTGLIQLEGGNADSRTSNDIRNWGSEISGATGTIQNGEAKQDAMRILQAWILHTGSGLLGVPALIKIGHMPVQINELAYSHTKFGDDALLLGVDPVKELHLILGTVKLTEGATYRSDDANGYTLIASYDIDKDSAVGLNVTYADAQNGSLSFVSTPLVPDPISGIDAHLWNISINGKTRVGGLGIKGELDVQTGKVEDIPGVSDQSFRGWAGKLDFDYTINPVTLMLGGAYSTGENINAHDNKIRTFITTMDAIQHFTFVYEYLTKNAAGNTNGGLQNTWFLKLGAKADLMKDLDGMLNIYYLRASKKVSNTYDSKSIGTEVDMNLNYKIDRNLKYFVEGGYLFAGNFWKNVTGTHSVDDAWALRHGIQLTF